MTQLQCVRDRQPGGYSDEVKAHLVILFVLLATACTSEEPSIRLEILSPAEGRTGSAIQYRMTRTGPISVSRLYVVRTALPNSVLRQVDCGANFGPTCEGTVDVPQSKDTYEVWADLVLNDEANTTLVTERQTVLINALPMIATPLEPLTTAGQFTFLVTGENGVDASTLSSIKVVRRFALLPYPDLPTRPDIGLADEELPVTATFSGNFLRVQGNFKGPARYLFDFSGVKNQYGSALGKYEVDRAFLRPSMDLGRVFISGVGISPHFEKAADGTLFVIVNGKARKLMGSVWVDVTTWDQGLEPQITVAPDGTVLRVEGDSSGAHVSRWTGTEWSTFPTAAMPPGQTGYNYFQGRIAVARDGTIFLAALRSPTLPYFSDAWLYRWSGSAWQLIEQRVFSPHVSALELAPFEQTVAMLLGDQRIETLQGSVFVAIASPAAALATLSGTTFYSLRNLRVDGQGTPHLLAGYFDAADTSGETATPSSGTAVLRYSGNAWSVVASGNLLRQAWIARRNVTSDLMIREFTHRAWTFNLAGTPHVFTREIVNPSQGVDTKRLAVCAYAFTQGSWGPMEGVPSPVLAREERGVPQPFPLQTPMALYDAAFDSGGRLWTITLVSPHGNVAAETYVLNSNP